MNYRHAYHAGNFADVMKHALLARLIAYLAAKDTPFFVLDTHAGRGSYDLAAETAQRTLEWQGGIGRLDAGPLASAKAEALLAPYRAALAEARARHGAKAYPGSTLIIRQFLRRQDRCLAVELHERDYAALAGLFGSDARVKTLHLDGWLALNANIPPKERRGLVLIDPPYEADGEFGRLAEALAKAWSKWPNGLYAAWYPIKDAPSVAALAQSLSASPLRKVLRLEMMIDDWSVGERLVGSGLIVVNPPYTLAGEAQALLPALAARLARRTSAGASPACRIEWLAGEEPARPQEPVRHQERAKPLAGRRPIGR